MLQHLPIEKVFPNPDQPRKIFDAKKLSDLALSIQAGGLHQPITVKPAGDGYMIIMGERRWRAHCILAERNALPSNTIHCHVSDADEETVMVNAIVENMQRADITPLEEAHAFKRLMDETGWDEFQAARKLGISQSWRITYRIRLLSLAPEHQTLLAGNHITLNAAQEIAKLKPADQTRIVKRISGGDLKGDTQVATAVAVILDDLSQEDIFGTQAAVSEADVATLRRMEKKISQVQQLLAQGWKDGECVAASKVSPDRAGLMADKIEHIIRSLKTMEKSLRETSIQVEMVMDQNAA